MQTAPAFPIPGSEAMYFGATILDWFAGQALIGLLAYSGNDLINLVMDDPAAASKLAYDFAEAMHAEKLKREEYTPK